jgi:hypothetical protein
VDPERDLVDQRSRPPDRPRSRPVPRRHPRKTRIETSCRSNVPRRGGCCGSCLLHRYISRERPGYSTGRMKSEPGSSSPSSGPANPQEVQGDRRSRRIEDLFRAHNSRRRNRHVHGWLSGEGGRQTNGIRRGASEKPVRLWALMTPLAGRSPAVGRMPSDRRSSLTPVEFGSPLFWIATSPQRDIRQCRAHHESSDEDRN